MLLSWCSLASKEKFRVMVAFSLQNPVEGLNTVPQLPLIVISCVLVVRGIGSVASSLKQLTARFSETFCVTALLPDSTLISCRVYAISRTILLAKVISYLDLTSIRSSCCKSVFAATATSVYSPAGTCRLTFPNSSSQFSCLTV